MAAALLAFLAGVLVLAVGLLRLFPRRTRRFLETFARLRRVGAGVWWTALAIVLFLTGYLPAQLLSLAVLLLIALYSLSDRDLDILS